MTDRDRSALLLLLEALCEERLTPEQHARLDRAVVTDPEARRLYLEYVELHGMLYWDTAVAAPAEQPLIPVAVADPHSVFTPQSRRFVAAVCAAAVIVIAAAVVPIAWNAGNDGPEATAPVADVDSAESRPLHNPIGPPVVIGGLERGRESAAERPASAEHGLASGTRAPKPIANPADAEDIVSAINRAIEEGWAEAGIEPSPVANDAEWGRRVWLDLAGRIPTPDETEQFLSDAREDKRARLIDALLERPEFARHFATGWTNLLVGREVPPELDRDRLFRFLQDQFARGRPWSETVAALVTAEGAADENGAANFLLAHLNNQAVPATAVTARCFLGMQVQCTQCHAHPFYPGWGQEQFWELNSFFQQTEVVPVPRDGGRTLQISDRAVGGPTFYENRSGEMKVAFPRFSDTEIDAGTAVNRRQELARLLVSGERPQLARAFVNRTWAHFFRFGFTNPVDDMGPHNPPTHPELLDRLADEFVASGYDVQALCRAICRSRPYQLTSLAAESHAVDAPEEGDPPLFSRMYVKPLTAEQVFDSLLVATEAQPGDWSFSPEADVRRQEWIARFFLAEETDENCESTTFDGALPQALAMMNGDLVQRAVSGAESTRLAEILRSTPDEAERIRRITLAVLSRHPTREELSAVRELVRRNVRQMVQSGRAPSARVAVEESLRDVFWAYLNSSEFIVNH